jgi:UDP-glucose 4-epimerase
MERIRVLEAARLICGLFGHLPRFVTRPEMPTGPLNRVADNGLAARLLGWRPAVAFADGARATAEWYAARRTPEEAARALAGGGLIARHVPLSR